MATVDFRRTGYRTGTGPAADARDRILLGAAVADLREALYRQQCVLEALFEVLAERDLLDDAEVRDRAEALYSAGLPSRPDSSS